MGCNFSATFPNFIIVFAFDTTESLMAFTKAKGSQVLRCAGLGAVHDLILHNSAPRRCR